MSGIDNPYWPMAPSTGSYQDVLMTKDYAPPESDVLEHKFYAQGIGPALVVQVSGGSSTEKLLSFEPEG